jgi:8-oxo-dGTP diphosphatase
VVAFAAVEAPRSPLVLVSAAVIISAGRVLLTQRKSGTHLAGAWEFPGGKVEPDEDPRDALVRELAEEIGVTSVAGDIVEATFHRYPAKSVLLLFYETRLLPGSPEPRAIDVAGVRWAEASELHDELFPPADVAVLAKVRAKLQGFGGEAPIGEPSRS